MNVVIGCDPDSDKHGIAVYKDGKLTSLLSLRLLELMDLIRAQQSLGRTVIVSIENVCGCNAVFGARASIVNRARSLGKVQQSQIEIERLCERLGVEIRLHKISKNWKSQAGKKQFKAATGWSGRSNEDTRSAAWFGFIERKLLQLD